jgi:hypothetical protein
MLAEPAQANTFRGDHTMFYEGFLNFLNFLNFIITPPDQPQKYIAFAGSILLLIPLIAVIDRKWGRGIGFTVLALLAIVFYVFTSMVILQGMQKNLELELTDPQSWASLGFYIGMVYWYIIELPSILGLGIGAVILSALSRQRGWIICNAVVLALTVLAPLLATLIIRAIQPDTDIFSPLAVHDRDTRLFQVHLAFVVVLFAIQLLYLSYGVWRIWRSVGLRRSSASATPLPSAQS